MKQRIEMHKASPEAYHKLSLAIATINAWNRLAVGMRFIPKV